MTSIAEKLKAVGGETSQVAHQACTYPGFSSMKWLGVFLLLHGWDARSIAGLPLSMKFADTHFYTHPAINFKSVPHATCQKEQILLQPKCFYPASHH